MHVLSLVNQKGGCGKTTAAVNLAGALAGRGRRVLLIDLDPQAHATMSVGCAIAPGEATIGDVLLDRATMREAVRRVPGELDLVPADEDVAEFEETAARLIWPERLLARALQSVSTEYDYVLVDCPPRVDGVLAANALRACDTALLVVETGAFALQGALKAVRILGRISQDLDHDLQVRVLCTMFDRRTRLGRELLIGMQSHFGELLFDTAVHTSQRLREAAAMGVPVQVLDPRSRAATDFAELAAELEAHASLIITHSAARTAPPPLSTALATPSNRSTLLHKS
jgi:chromosome partitioning protein